MTSERVQALGKALPHGDGENVGMLKFSGEGSRALFGKIQKLLTQNHDREMVPFAVDALAADRFVAAVPVQSLPWLEIDFPEDYQRAREVIYPAICDARSTSTSCTNKPLVGRSRQEV